MNGNAHLLKKHDGPSHMPLKNVSESTYIRKDEYLLARSPAVSISTCESELPFCGHIDSENREI